MSSFCPVLSRHKAFFRDPVAFKKKLRHDAEDAIDGLDGRKYDGRELSVQYAR